MLDNNQTKTSYAELITPEHDCQEWRDLDTTKIKNTFKKHGAILFRGFEGGLDQLVTMSDQFCDSYMINANTNRDKISKEKRVTVVAKKKK